LSSMRAVWTAPALRLSDAVVSAEAEEASVLGSVAPVEEAGKAAQVDRSKLVVQSCVRCRACWSPVAVAEPIKLCRLASLGSSNTSE